MQITEEQANEALNDLDGIALGAGVDAGVARSVLEKYIAEAENDRRSLRVLRSDFETERKLKASFACNDDGIVTAVLLLDQCGDVVRRYPIFGSALDETR